MEIEYSKAAGVATLRFNRLAKKNAITSAMYQTLADGLRDAAADSTVRVIVIGGQPGIFTSGNDVEDFLKNPPQGTNSPVAQFMMQMMAAEKPVIASVAGIAIGIGSTLLLHCDLVYAAENARFAMPFAQLGLCPEFGSSLLLSQLAGHQRAAELLMLGEPFSATEAEALGLVNQTLAPELLEDFVAGQAAKLAALPSESMRTTKRLMKAAQAAQLNDTVSAELKEFSRLLVGPDAREALAAFVGKRKPVFS